jgi:hypothetical protein
MLRAIVSASKAARNCSNTDLLATNMDHYVDWIRETAKSEASPLRDVMELPRFEFFAKKETETLASELGVLKISVHGYQHYRDLRRKA